MQFFTGKVVSSKTPQTVAVEVPYFKKHTKYQKIIKLTTKLLAHSELESVKEGDTVKIVKSRPYSKLKHFLVTEIIGSTKQAKEEVKPAEKKVETKNIKVKKTIKKSKVSKK